MDDDTIVNFDYLAKVVYNEIEDVNDNVDDHIYCSSTIMRNQYVWRDDDSPIIGKWSHNYSDPTANFPSKLHSQSIETL